MRKVGLIFLTTVFLTGNTQLVQLLKFPALFFHFSEHAANNNVSFLEYLHNHYLHVHKDKDYSRDKQLPFMNTENTTNKDANAIAPLSIQKQTIALHRTCLYLVYRPIHVLAAYHTSIWQPPRA
ncbi:MAG TPA: hypothetical protein VK174_18475 [Chitinophagales bacterium]|nr:hypothetical protein [Chitinophagales bacterium]